jgi:hypothetical protein
MFAKRYGNRKPETGNRKPEAGSLKFPMSFFSMAFVCLVLVNFFLSFFDLVIPDILCYFDFFLFLDFCYCWLTRASAKENEQYAGDIVKQIYLTGGNMATRGMRDRFLHDIIQMRPIGDPINVFLADGTNS